MLQDFGAHDEIEPAVRKNQLRGIALHGGDPWVIHLRSHEVESVNVLDLLNEAPREEAVTCTDVESQFEVARHQPNEIIDATALAGTASCLGNVHSPIA